MHKRAKVCKCSAKGLFSPGTSYSSPVATPGQARSFGCYHRAKPSQNKSCCLKRNYGCFLYFLGVKEVLDFDVFSNISWVSPCRCGNLYNDAVSKVLCQNKECKMPQESFVSNLGTIIFNVAPLKKKSSWRSLSIPRQSQLMPRELVPPVARTCSGVPEGKSKMRNQAGKLWKNLTLLGFFAFLYS